MCRMCLRRGRRSARRSPFQPSCFIAVSEGMAVDTQSDKVKKAQDGVLEFLLANHPLDCPVCDKGGECPLQDQTLAYGPGESRFVEEKRHFEKPIAISDLCAARPGAVHPVCTVHPVRRRGGRRGPDRFLRTAVSWSKWRLPDRTVLVRISVATPCRSARWVHSPPRPIGSRLGRGTSTRSSPPAPHVRLVAASPCNPLRTA